jgi:PTS system N-acetylglucosamine-specific IIC component
MSATKSRFSAGSLQSLGRALMLPIAVLPVAGLLLRLGQPDLLDIAFVAAAGDAIFHNLGLLFAIGVAVGFARDGNGAAGLAGVVCFLVATNGAEALIAVPNEALANLTGPSRDLAIAAFRAAALSKLSVPLGTLSGLIAGNFYNRFGAIALPDYLAFFGGRRFVPIVSGLGGLVLAGLFGRGWSVLSTGIDAVSHAIVGAGPIGLFAYGLLNRLLLVTGLHHILNNVVWFIVGSYHGATGDLNRFFAGDPSAGAFMAGFFPVMIFGLPAGCLAMYHAARPERRAEVGGMLLSLALTAMLTGVTEPIEFTFMFLAPVLFAIHAALTGAAMVLMDALHIRLGFGFSAGLLDFALNYGRATRPLWLVPIGLLYAGLYYGLFRYFIVRFDLQTPGRDLSAKSGAGDIASGSTRASRYVEALGGAANLASVDACTTRLRLVVVDAGIVDDGLLKGLGARGVIRLSSGRLQVVIGPVADQVAREIRGAIGDVGQAPITVDQISDAPAPVGDAVAQAWRDAFGGGHNLLEVGAVSSRLRIRVGDDSLIDAARLRALGSRGLVQLGPGSWQVILGPVAVAVATGLVTMPRRP